MFIKSNLFCISNGKVIIVSREIIMNVGFKVIQHTWFLGVWIGNWTVLLPGYFVNRMTLPVDNTLLTSRNFLQIRFAA